MRGNQQESKRQRSALRCRCPRRLIFIVVVVVVEPIAAMDEDEFEWLPALLSNTYPPMDDPLPIASSSHELDDDSIAQFSALTSNH
ncbi:hypothetical protein AAC387_Pa12g0967 [Persea americana]